MRLFACASLLVALASCTSGAPSSAPAAARCEGFSRLAAHEGVAWWLGDDGKPARIPAACGDSTCLRSNVDTIEVTQKDGSVWSLARGAAAPVLLPPEAPRITLDGAGPAPPAPRLPPELRTCGATEAGGGYGYMVIDNATNTWLRVEWARPPQTDEVKALGPGQYPIAGAGGVLCAVATQTAPRMWRAHLIRANKDVDLQRDTEHPAASCAAGDLVVVHKSADVVVAIDPDGHERPPLPSGTAALNTRLSVSERRTVHDKGATAVLVDRAGSAPPTSLALPLDKDLAGRALPPGTEREQLLAAGDGDHRLLVAERFRHPDCSVTESLTLVDLDDPTRTTAVAPATDVVYTRLAYGLDRFLWVKAPPQVDAQ